MAKATKAAPKKAAKKLDENVMVTLDELIEGAKETIEQQLQDPIMGKISANEHAKAARTSLVHTVLMGQVDTELTDKALHNYITEELEIIDKK